MALGIMTAAVAAATSFSHPTIEEFHKELKVEVVKEAPNSEKTCTIYLVYSGSTDWLEKGQMQGWEPVHLNERGKQQMLDTAQSLATKIGTHVSAIYASSIPSACESAAILQKALDLPVSIIPIDALKGECHGEYDGYEEARYKDLPHFREYKSLSREDQIFFPCGEGENKNKNKAESKADVAIRAVPKIKEIASQHLDEKIIIVTHRGLFTLFNLYLEKHGDQSRTVPAPNGTSMHIEANKETLYLISAEPSE